MARKDWDDFVKLRTRLLGELAALQNGQARSAEQADVQLPDANTGK